MRILAHAARTLAKLLRRRPHERGLAVGFANAVSTANFLAFRRLGISRDARLTLGYGGRCHSWIVRRREDLTVLEEVFLDEDYDIAIPPPAVVFDLGANFGAASVYFALRWPKAQIFALEPNPDLYSRLLDATAGYENITCLPCAAGAADERMLFRLSKSSVSGGFYCQDVDAEVIEVQVRTLHSLMAERAISRINLLKFDIEGAEGLIFREPAILELIDAFVGEVHPDLMTESVEMFLARFSAFEITRLNLGAGRFLLRGRRKA